MTHRLHVRAGAGLAAGILLWLLPAVAVAGPPPGWKRVGSEEGFDLGLEPDGGRGGSACARLQGIAPEDGAMVGIAQTVDVTRWRGRRVRLSAWIRTEAVAEWGGLFFRVSDGDGELVSYGNTRRDPIRGTTEWRRYEVVVEIPETAVSALFGAHLYGMGTLWTDDFDLEAVGRR